METLLWITISPVHSRKQKPAFCSTHDFLWHVTLLLLKNLDPISNPISLARPLKAYPCCELLTHANSTSILTQQLLYSMTTTKPKLSNSWPVLEQRLTLIVRTVQQSWILFLFFFFFHSIFFLWPISYDCSQVFNYHLKDGDFSTICLSSDLYYLHFMDQKTGAQEHEAIKYQLSISGVCSVQFSSVAQSCPTFCDPMNRSTSGLPVHHHLQEFTQTHVHQVGDAIQPSHPLLSRFPSAPNPSQHQGLFQWVNSSHEVAKVLEFQL